MQQKLLHIALTLAIHKYIFVQDSLILAKTQFRTYSPLYIYCHGLPLAEGVVHNWRSL